MEDNSYIKRAGTTDRGKEYEDFIVAALALKYAKDPNLEHFYLSSNHSQFGAFDDVVLEARNLDGTFLNYALQLKHVNKDDGAFKNKLSGPKGNFSIQKYFEDFKNTNEKSGFGSSFRFALFTNHKFDPAKDATLTLPNLLVVKIVKLEQALFKFSETRGNCFQFIIDKEATVPNFQEYQQFLDKFFVYTNQANVDEVKTETIKKFVEMFACDSEQAEQYLTFIAEWSKFDGRKKKLNGEFIRNAIAVHLMAPAVVPFWFEPSTSNDKLQVFRSVISDFDVTFIGEDGAEKVRKVWGNLNTELPDLATINKMATEYRLILEPVKSTNELSEDTKTKLLWLLGQYPLIVKTNKTIYKVIDLCPNKKFIVVGDWLSKDDVKNLTILQKFSDLDPNSDKYNTILKSFTCILRDNQEISLEALFELNPKIQGVITTTELLQMANNSFKMAQVVQLLALSDPETNAMCQKGYTPLHVACIKGDEELVKLIVKSDIDVSGASKDGDSPTILATQHGHYNIVKLLLEHGANVNAADKYGYRAVQIACSKENYDLVKLLGEFGADINAADKDGIAPLQVAATKGNYKIANLLLELKANVNGANMHGETAMFLACSFGHADIVKLLMEAKAKNVSNEVANTGLHMASLKGHTEVVRVLLDYIQENEEAADVNYDDYEALLSDNSVDINAGNKIGNTPLLVAALNGHKEVVQLLKEKGANVDIRNRPRLTALDLARQRGHEEVVKLLS